MSITVCVLFYMMNQDERDCMPYARHLTFVNYALNLQKDNGILSCVLCYFLHGHNS